MKRLIITALLSLAAAGRAFAADLPQPAPPPPRAPAVYVAPVYNWAGIYIGINGGWGFGSSTWTDPVNPSGAGNSGSFNTSGGLVGGTLGVNWQANAFVFGVETDLDWQNLKGSVGNTFCGSLATATGVTGLSCQTQSNWVGTVRGRLGFAADRVLFYGTAGGAYGNVQAGLNTLPLQSSTEFGWTAGAGIEGAFADNWTAKVEYLYVDLGNSANCNTTASCGFEGVGGAAANNSVKFTESMVRAGINYKFNF
jgi:outer membrane immunogenic protein